MNGAEFRSVCDFESGLNPGVPVMVKWTHSNGCYGCTGRVVKLNRKSVKVAIDKPVGYGVVKWDAGFVVTVPLIGDLDRWSCNNRVEPLSGYGGA